MNIHKTLENTALTLALEGRLDTTTAPRLEAELKASLSDVTELNLRVRAFAGERGLPLTVGRVTQADLDRLKAAGCGAAVCGGYYHRLPVDPALRPSAKHDGTAGRGL